MLLTCAVNEFYVFAQCHGAYCAAAQAHSAHANPTTAATAIAAHNDYVQQLRASNGMIDQYYRQILPELLQELDDVYQDVSAVVADSLARSVEVMTIKVNHAIY